MKRSAAALLLGALLAAASPSLAEEPSVAQARMLFNAGAQAYSKGDFRGAIQAFEQAYKLAPRPGLLFSMAQAYRKQHALDQQPADLHRAIALYRDYVAQVPTGGRRSDAAQALAELDVIASRAAPAEPAAAPAAPPASTRVAVSSQTPGAMVSIDGGKPAEAPLMAEVPPGKHRVRITAEGHFDQEREVDAQQGGVFPVDVTLTPRPARLTIVAPDAALVSIDGRAAGLTPLPGPLELPAGAHFVVVSKNGHRPFTEEIKLRRGEARTLRAELDTTGQRFAAYGFLLGGAGAAVFGIVSTGLALHHQGQAEGVLRDKETTNISPGRLDDYAQAAENRDRFRGLATIGFGAGAALGLTGLLLYAFDRPEAQARPPRGVDAPSAPAPGAPAPVVEIVARPIWSPGAAGGALIGRF
jgi:hypothetical protein